MRKDIDRINELARKAAADYHREQAKRFLECAIRDVARLLREHAEMMEELG